MIRSKSKPVVSAPKSLDIPPSADIAPWITSGEFISLRLPNPPAMNVSSPEHVTLTGRKTADKQRPHNGPRRLSSFTKSITTPVSNALRTMGRAARIPSNSSAISGSSETRSKGSKLKRSTTPGSTSSKKNVRCKTPVEDFIKTDKRDKPIPALPRSRTVSHLPISSGRIISSPIKPFALPTPLDPAKYGSRIPSPPTFRSPSFSKAWQSKLPTSKDGMSPPSDQRLPFLATRSGFSSCRARPPTPPARWPGGTSREWFQKQLETGQSMSVADGTREMPGIKALPPTPKTRKMSGRPTLTTTLGPIRSYTTPNLVLSADKAVDSAVLNKENRPVMENRPLLSDFDETPTADGTNEKRQSTLTQASVGAESGYASISSISTASLKTAGYAYNARKMTHGMAEERAMGGIWSGSPVRKSLAVQHHHLKDFPSSDTVKPTATLDSDNSPRIRDRPFLTHFVAEYRLLQPVQADSPPASIRSTRPSDQMTRKS